MIPGFCVLNRSLLPLILVLTSLLAQPALAGLSSHEILLVVNGQSQVSQAIGSYYQAVRGIPDINVCTLSSCPNSEYIDPNGWYDNIRAPIWNYLNASSHPWLKDQVKVILLTKGVPIRFWADGNRQASVDMPLCYMGNTSSAGIEPTGWCFGQSQALGNAYFGLDQAFDTFRLSVANEYSTPFPDFLDICTFDGSAILTAGDNGLLVRSGDGLSWAALSDRARSFSGKSMTCLSHIGSIGWVTESNGRILKSTDNGISWWPVRDSSDGNLNGISFGDSNNGWAVGTQNGPLILHTDSGGGWGSWTPLDPPFLGGPYCTTLNGVCATGSNGAVVCGSNSTILTWTWPANIWAIAEGVPNVNYNSVPLVPSGDTYVGWVVGDEGTILETVDNGTTWQQQTNLFTGSLKKVYALDANQAWITTGTNTLLRTTDGGDTWNILSLATGQNLASVTFSSSTNGFGVSGKSILSTSDGGTTWLPAFAGHDTTWHVNYLTCRLDSYQNEESAHANDLPFDIKRMINDACSPDTTGRFILDNPSANADGTDMASASATLLDMKNNGVAGIEEVVLDEQSTYLTGQQRTMGYYSWGSNDGNSRSNTQWAQPRNSWQKGSIGNAYVSSSGRTLNYPPDYTTCVPVLKGTSSDLQGILQITGCWKDWSGVLHDDSTVETISAISVYGKISFPLSHSIVSGYLQIYSDKGYAIQTARVTATTSAPFVPTQYYEIGNQSLAADLIREGCDATIGNVWEPYRGSCGLPQYLFPRYVAGYTWGESAYMSLASGGWMELTLGDPLMAAYATPPTVTLTSPGTDGAVISGTAYTVTATAMPNNAPGINRVEFWLSDGDDVDALIGTDTSAPHSITFDTTTLPAPYGQAIADGRYILEAIAYEDTNVREVGRASRPVVINNGGSPTSLDITNPSVDGTTLSNTATITVSANPSTPPSTARIDLWLHRPGRDDLIGSIDTAPFNFQFDTTAVPYGNYTLQAVAYSSTGQASASTVRQVIVDNRTLIEIANPSTDGQVKSGVFTAEATVSPTATISSVEFWLGQGADQGILLASDTTSPYTYDIDSTTFADGDYVIRALAYTTGPSPAVDSARRTVTFNNSSLLTFTIPSTDGQEVSGNLVVQVTAGSATPPVTQVDLWPTGVADWIVTSTDTQSPFNWTIDTTTVPNGTNVTMRAEGIKQGGAHITEHPVRTISVNNPNLLSITQPTTDGTVVSGNTTIVIGTQTTTPDYGSIKIFLSDQSDPWVLTSRPFEYTFDTQNYTNGIYTVTVYGYKPDGRLIANSSATRTIIINNQYTRCANTFDARRLPDDSGVLLQNKTVTAGTGGPMAGTFYIQEPDKMSGLRVIWSGSTVPTGKTVTIMGTIGNNTNTGERQVTADTVYVGSDATSIQPIGMVNRDVGGAPLTSEPYTSGITNGIGLYNTGLLIRVWGNITYIGTDCFYIDDGSNLQDGNVRGAPVVVPLDGGAIAGAASP